MSAPPKEIWVKFTTPPVGDQVGAAFVSLANLSEPPWPRYVLATPALLDLIEAAKPWGRDFGPDEEDALHDAVLAYAKEARDD